MQRRWKRGLRLAVAMAPLLGIACGDFYGGAKAEASACKRVKLIDGETGEPVIGAEDLAVDTESGQVYLSAYDRWALEDAVSGDAAELPQGAIYAAPLRSLRRKPERLPLRRLAGGSGPDFHPHGIALHRSGDTARLFAINHAYERTVGAWERHTRLDTFDITQDGLKRRQSIEHERLCRANNLTALSDLDVLITRDHGACGRLGRWMEDVFGLDRGQVVLASWTEGGDATVETVVDGLSYANGIALAPNGTTLAVATTRGEAIRFYDIARLLGSDGPAHLTSIEVDGGPDNIAWDAEGRLIAAVHPSLFSAGLARQRWFGHRRAGSRVIAAEPGSGQVQTLLHDSEGRLLNAATAATLHEDTLVVSAVLDDALMVCN